MYLEGWGKCGHVERVPVLHSDTESAKIWNMDCVMLTSLLVTHWRSPCDIKSSNFLSWNSVHIFIHYPIY